jgi:Fe-S-cluster containining protein
MLESYKLKLEQARKQLPESRKFFARLKKQAPHDLDQAVQELHDEVFSVIDCLQCAACCAGLGPRVTDKDIQQMAPALRVKPSVLAQKYLKLDEDGDYVFKAMPCPFLMADNYCSIYVSRPKACAGYPHTDRRRFIQLLDITLKNLLVCPAVFEIVAGLKIRYK